MNLNSIFFLSRPVFEKEPKNPREVTKHDKWLILAHFVALARKPDQTIKMEFRVVIYGKVLIENECFFNR